MNRTTPLKRSSKPMKRTEIKRTGFSSSVKPLERSDIAKRKRKKAGKTAKRKNSRPWEDLALRERYRAENRECELTHLMEMHGMKEPEWHAENPVVVHHIFHTGRERWDLTSNLISLRSSVHHWLHNGNEFDLTVLCLWAKFIKNEFNIDDLNTARGAVGEGANPVWARLNKERCKHDSLALVRETLIHAINQHVGD